jgi:ABC-type glycerol-3-phosphate transport system substrate-binding protein
VASYRGVVYRVKVFSVLYPFGPLPSTDPDKRLTWDQVVQLAKKVQVEKNGVVEGWGFAFQQYDRPYQLLPLLQSNGAAALSPDGKTVNGFLNSPAAIEAAGFYGDLFKKQRVSPREQVPNLLYTGKLVTEGVFEITFGRFRKAAEGIIDECLIAPTSSLMHLAPGPLKDVVVDPNGDSRLS